MIEYNKILKADLIEMHKAELARADRLAHEAALIEGERMELRALLTEANAKIEDEKKQTQAMEELYEASVKDVATQNETIAAFQKAHELNANTIEKLMKDRDTAALDRELAIQAASSSFDAMQLMRRKVEQVERDATTLANDAASYAASEHKQAIMNALAKLPKMDAELRQMILNTVHAVPLRK